MNLPTLVTLSRLFGLPFMFYFLHDPTPSHRWISVAIFLGSAGTDWLDGYLARRLNQVTELGKFLDPLVDKLLVLAPLLSLIELGKVPSWGVFLIMSRELAITSWRVNLNLTTQNRKVQEANWWGKLKTVSQIIAIALLIVPLSPQWWGTLCSIVFWVAVLLTLISGVSYLLPQILSKTELSKFLEKTNIKNKARNAS
ncbi:CDP-diacylglycerol--glycerol-3-phosphate 3-phosphatidyltransferase [cyanobacterium endosymbiont of Epithemia turgida]|uniref:CDP-diacylglycerol--glycerol-3-phosphate 3-phosphatidyltransferase n=1 Tax=cyanobacterium endosymbiont of Epithemia turgida TaxID=718217 RepID=UPI0004D1CA47|nr:CDP-diacylglycerol--glycerol-3-phosphate 3-phosphatidyltransferase [cyanobacterium endosymbiont of Epithemia turgida]BAP18584.1 CDP-diacylglycerol--glycerol-3-phosphate 3-phosphatidyltransferase [cyanobacterium endosymbiont of Epithemia turgida isolate EtSB Lake Yunoko]